MEVVAFNDFKQWFKYLYLYKVHVTDIKQKGVMNISK